MRSTNMLQETLGDIKWSSIRPAVKDKYSFSVAAFNTPSKSVSTLQNRSRLGLNSSSGGASPFTSRARVSFGGNSLQRSLLSRSHNTSHNRSHNVSHNTSVVLEDKKPIKVKPIPRTAIRPGVTSNTAKKILEQLVCGFHQLFYFWAF